MDKTYIVSFGYQVWPSGLPAYTNKNLGLHDIEIEVSNCSNFGHAIDKAVLYLLTIGRIEKEDIKLADSLAIVKLKVYVD